MKKKTIVVFGATGHLGTHIAIHLKERGYDVVAVGKRIHDNGFFSTFGIPYFSVDITSKKSFSKLPQNGIYAVLHFAGALPASMEGYNPDLYVSSIIQGTLNVLEYTKAVCADRIVFPQSLFDISYLFGTRIPIPADSIRRAPMVGDHSIYVIAKNAAVDLIEHYYYSYGIKRFILRLSRVYMYDPNPFTYTDGKKTMISDRFLIYQAMKGNDIEIWGDPNRLLETCSVGDFLRIVEGTLKATHDGGLYNIGSGGSTLEERVMGIIDVFCPKNKVSKVVYVPEKDYGQQFVLDITKTRIELGYKPLDSWVDYLYQFKKEMETQPFGLLWGYEKDYVKDSMIL